MEETNKQVENVQVPVMDQKEANERQLKMTRTMKVQSEQALDFANRDLDIRKKILNYELENCQIINDKPAFMTSPDYMVLVNEHKKLMFEVNKIKAADEIAKQKAAIKKIDAEITRLMRNGNTKVEDKK